MICSTFVLYKDTGTPPLYEHLPLAGGGGNREQGTGNREQGTGNREQGTGNREQGQETGV